MSDNATNKRRRNNTKHDFLLTLFPDKKQEYSEIAYNGYHLVRQWSGTTNRWEVAIYTKDAYNRKKQYLAKPYYKQEVLTSTLRNKR